MRRVRLVTAGVLALAACITPNMQRDSDLAVAERWSASIRPTEGGTITGSAIVTQLAPGRAHVTITLAGSRDGATHPWDIHQGACGDDGPVVGNPRSYTAMPIGGAGAATMQTELPINLRKGGRYYVDVHDSPMRMHSVSCGALTHVGSATVARNTP